MFYVIHRLCFVVSRIVNFPFMCHFPVCYCHWQKIPWLTFKFLNFFDFIRSWACISQSHSPLYFSINFTEFRFYLIKQINWISWWKFHANANWELYKFTTGKFITDAKILEEINYITYFHVPCWFSNDTQYNFCMQNGFIVKYPDYTI